MLALRQNGALNGTLIAYELEADAILTDASAPLKLRYIKRVTTTGLWDPLFVDVVVASEISDEEKQLVWDFIKITMSPEFQRDYAIIAGNTPPSPDADVTGVEADVPHFQLLIDSQKAAAAAGVDRIPTGLEIQYGEFSKMIQEEVQRMLIEDLDPADVVKTMQTRAEEIQKG